MHRKASTEKLLAIPFNVPYYVAQLTVSKKRQSPYLLAFVNAEACPLQDGLRGGGEGEVHVHHLPLPHGGQIVLVLARVVRHGQQATPHLAQPPERL